MAPRGVVRSPNDLAAGPVFLALDGKADPLDRVRRRTVGIQRTHDGGSAGRPERPKCAADG
ncbi:MAG: hypothetical protein BGO98_14685 [Myxococcales bacterium 68-20]|nr:MAG: hypothetical protein BGO98_14685 [Myxococcales bacterium 68-20]